MLADKGGKVFLFRTMPKKVFFKCVKKFFQKIMCRKVEEGKKIEKGTVSEYLFVFILF